MPPGRTNMAKIGIIGAGTWGIALSILLHDNGHKISVWVGIAAGNQRFTGET